MIEREEKVTQKPEKQVIKNEVHLLLQLENQAQQIERLTEQIEYLTRKLFGTSSEKLSEKNQLSLFDEEESFFDQAETTEEETVEMTASKRPKEIGRKTALTKHIPVTREVQLELSEEGCLRDNHARNGHRHSRRVGVYSLTSGKNSVS